MVNLIMKLEYKQFDFAETLRGIDSALSPKAEELMPMKQFLLDNDKPGIEYAYAGVISVCVHLSVYDNCDVVGLSCAYDTIKRVLLDIFRSNSDCIDIFCMGRYFCGIYNATVKSNIDGLIETMAKLNAALSVLDIKLNDRFNIKVKGNCGCDFGELFRINNSYIKPDNKAEKNQIVSQKKNNNFFTSWHGAPLNMAMLYSGHKIKNDKNGTIISDNIKSNIKEAYVNFFTEYDAEISGYWASLVDSEIFQWVKSNK